jgi:hypothetical protein
MFSGFDFYFIRTALSFQDMWVGRNYLGPILKPSIPCIFCLAIISLIYKVDILNKF